MPLRKLLLLCIALHLALASVALAAPAIRENLDYQVSLGPWDDVASWLRDITWRSLPARPRGCGSC